MSEEFSQGTSGAAAGAKIGSMIAPGIGTVAGAIIGGVVGMFSGRGARKARQQAAREQDKLTATQMMSAAKETGRVSRFEAATQRSLYSASGVSTSSGSAAEMERGMLAESIYQQEAVLAGLPKKHHGYKNIAGRIEVRN